MGFTRARTWARIGVLAVLFASLLWALPSARGPMVSSKVVIIGGSSLDTSPNGTDYLAANYMGFTYGGMLCINPAIDGGVFSGFQFTAMLPADVNAASLAPYDTAVLNVASRAMQGTTATLSTTQKQALVDFVANGKKLIIYDSEVRPGADYSWLPYAFTTNNPGAMGAQGTLNVIEDSMLASYDSSSPYFIDAVAINTYSDAVGDMNVMVTLDPHWYVNMSGTNINHVTGPVHTYARHGSIGHVGLLIYNGLDQDYQTVASSPAAPWLRKIWLQELLQEWNPDNLPGKVAVVGITLKPETATLEVGASHTLTANVTDLLGKPVENVATTIQVVSGPNQGAANAGPTNASGDLLLTYTGRGGCGGQDAIDAWFYDEAGTQRKASATADWIDKTAPTVTAVGATPNVLWSPNHTMRNVTVIPTVVDNCDPAPVCRIVRVTSNEPVNGLGDGDTAPDWLITGNLSLKLRAERAGVGTGRVYTISVACADRSGNVGTGSVLVRVPHDQQ
jgi:hypothetical protein